MASSSVSRESCTGVAASNTAEAASRGRTGRVREFTPPLYPNHPTRRAGPPTPGAPPDTWSREPLPGGSASGPLLVADYAFVTFSRPSVTPLVALRVSITHDALATTAA